MSELQQPGGISIEQSTHSAVWPAKVKVDILDYLVLDDHMEPAESIQNMGLHQEPDHGILKSVLFH